MPRYVTFVKYTTEALQGIRAGGYAARFEQLQAFGESLGVTMESMDFMIPGEWDFMSTISAPSVNEVLAVHSFSMASGTVERSVTSELFSGEQMDAAISKATPKYSPPGS